MIVSSATSSILGLRIADSVEPASRDLIRSSAQHSRAIAYFSENIESVNSVDELIADPDLYSFVMRAFDLEDQIFGKGLISKMLKSDIEDRTALINRLTDPRFKELYAALDFGEGGVGNTNTISETWQKSVIDRYVTRQFIDVQSDSNETVGIALEYREKISSVQNVFDILKDQDLSKVIRTAFGIPDGTAGLDIDRQAEILLDKIDIDELKKPDEIDRVMKRFAMISDALSGAAASANPAVQILQSSNAFVPVTIDLAAITSIPSNPYR
ncbi:hypothetical protein FIU97_12415 [Roseivivax sp. THAF40]|uniref:DUF1217 domain-containing protein n=1 Tax=Roseivivax sp. THAF40 TaxID=2587858 RepID=UPI0012682411|nr:DUF1217 domain-containing protein [Roseivivax sp. THAF40]QFT47383.1 hypothetical protein FIU97_12415 [Roseivivax sp. THAF40]